jgi:hypothetical protein
MWPSPAATYMVAREAGAAGALGLVHSSACIGAGIAVRDTASSILQAGLGPWAAVRKQGYSTPSQTSCLTDTSTQPVECEWTAKGTLHHCHLPGQQCHSLTQADR